MQAIDDFIDKVRHLPPAPRVIPELMKLLRETDVDSSKVVKLISFDPALTANVLRMCNSAYFAASTPTADLQEAVTRLGFQQVYQLVTVASGARLLAPAQKGYGLDQGELWKHSIASGVAAQVIARQLGDDENVVFTAALLHDIGKIILAQSLENVYFKLLKETETNQHSLLEAEQKLLGVQHAEVGGRLLTRWRFAPNMVSAVWFHHSPQAAGSHKRLAAYAYVGNMIAHFMGYGYGFQALALRGRVEALSILGIEPEAVPRFMMETYEQLTLVDALAFAG
jgi:putative nucleotidyltransferase with HDIG domain